MRTCSAAAERPPLPSDALTSEFPPLDVLLDELSSATAVIEGMLEDEKLISELGKVGEGLSGILDLSSASLDTDALPTAEDPALAAAGECKAGVNV